MRSLPLAPFNLNPIPADRGRISQRDPVESHFIPRRVCREPSPQLHPSLACKLHHIRSQAQWKRSMEPPSLHLHTAYTNVLCHCKHRSRLMLYIFSKVFLYSNMFSISTVAFFFFLHTQQLWC